MVSKAAASGLIAGLCTIVCPGGIICLQYADDTLLFLDNDLAHATNLKTILTCFEQVSGMRINYTKSELIPINIVEDDFRPFVSVLECKGVNSPLNILGFLFTMTNL